MSESDISTLARRLAEQNNVDWRALTGTGQGGKVLERDVLDYLARVMAGEEALDPTPEPLPQGMQSWPDQDAPSYFDPNAANRGSVTEQTPVTPQAAADTAEDVLSDDIFLFEEDAELEPGTGVADEVGQLVGPPAAAYPEQDEYEADFGMGLGGDTQLAEIEPRHAVAGLQQDDAGDVLRDVSQVPTDMGFMDDQDVTAARPDLGNLGRDDDDLLLVADDDFDVAPPPPADVQADQPAQPEYGDNIFERPLDAPLSDYSQEFTTTSERFESQGADSWQGAELTLSGDPLADDLSAQLDAADAANDLPDLWADDSLPEGPVQPRLEDEAVTFERAMPELEDEAMGYEQPAAEETAFVGEAVQAGRTEQAEQSDQPDPADQPDRWEQAQADEFGSGDPVGAAEPATDVRSGAFTGDDVLDLEQAEDLDELDAVQDVQALDGEVQPVAPADVSGLPFVRSATVIRRLVDLSALANAQLAAGLELGRHEPLSPAPFLLRAVAKAASQSQAVAGQVALAELDGGVTFRRVDDAASRPFSSLVQELEGSGPEEDELGLVAVDLSGFDIDEALLDIDVPAVTLGRILYDTQRDAYRGTLTLTGDLPFDQGVALLGRVADLLDAPVRLLL